MQFGSGWWFLDKKSSIEAQLNSPIWVAESFCWNVDRFSVLSYRADISVAFFNVIGNNVESNLFLLRMNFLGKILEDISYMNAKTFLTFNQSNQMK